MKRYINRLGMLALGSMLWLAGCVGALDRQPFVELTSAAVYAEFDNYKEVLAKLYAGLAVSGQQGPAGKPDISGIDEGFSSYLRQYWKAQELTTDEAIIGWNDGSLPDYHDMDWTAGNEFIGAMYSRIFYQVVLCNEFIRETTDEKLSQRDFTAAQVAEIQEYQAEARFLRAFSYWHAIDMFGTVPFVTEADRTGAFQPDPISRAELFTYVESELRELEALLPGARENEEGRLDQAAVWMLLAKLYLNAEVYIEQPKYTECLVELQKVLDAGYALDAEYDHLFLTDNAASDEIIWSIKFDGTRTLTWGGMTFLVHAPVGGSMDPTAFGINGGWNGIRTTPQFVMKFDTTNLEADSRANFYREGQTFEIERIFTFTDGWAIEKFRNVDQMGNPGTDPAGNHTDTDFPVFRLADAYLMYAEAVLRNGAGGSEATALDLVNELRARAYGNESGSVSSIDLPFILDERGRELYWEGHRRTDLIRFDRFTGGDYLWAWKGGVQAGRSVESFRNLFPIPTADLVANPKLSQNTGYAQ